MAQARLPVRKIREVLRLKAEGLSDRQIAAAIGSARSTVQECLRRCREEGLVWPLATELDEKCCTPGCINARCQCRAPRCQTSPSCTRNLNVPA